jgi:hypothetical protein
MSLDPHACNCVEPQLEQLPLWQTWQCGLCKKPLPKLSYTLTQVARMFRTSNANIKRRALDGELPYVVDADGHMTFTRDDLLPHLDELIQRNDRLA